MDIPKTLITVKTDEKLLGNEFCRKLFAESSSIFSNIQSSVSNNTFLTKKDLLSFSRKYRCVIQANCQNLKEQNKFLNQNDKNENLKDSNDDLYDTFKKIGILWHLCEMLFIDIHQTGILLNQLISWISWHFDNLKNSFNQVLQSENQSEHEDYWNVIFKLVFRKEIVHAKNLLFLHPELKSDDYILVAELLETMPLYTNEQVLYEFYHTWQIWNYKCKKVYEEHVFTNKNLLKLAGILSGDVKVFIEKKKLFETWYEFMVAMLLYTDPTVKESELTVLTIECLKHFYGKDFQSKFDTILISAFSYDLMNVIRLSCNEFNDNWWFVTHLIDLFYNSNQLEAHQVEEPKKLRDFFIYEYANTLMSHHVLWNVGLRYYDNSELSNNYLELSLEKIDVRNELTAKKILAVAEYHNLKYLQKSVCKILSKKWLSNGRYSSALNWAIKSEEEILITHLCDIFLKHYIKTDKFIDEDLINSLGPQMLKSDRLTFLAKYYEFHQLSNDKLISEASDLLISLIESKIAPYFFRPKLITDLIPLIEYDKCKITSKQISNINGALEEFRNDDQYEFLDENYDKNSFKEKEEILRIAITRKMSHPKNFLN